MVKISKLPPSRHARPRTLHNRGMTSVQLPVHNLYYAISSTRKTTEEQTQSKLPVKK